VNHLQCLRAVSEPYYSQRAQCLRLSERFFHRSFASSRLPSQRSVIAKNDSSQTDGWNCYHRLLALTLTPILTQTFCDSGPSRRLKVPWLRRSWTTFLLRPLAVAQHRFMKDKICFRYFWEKKIIFPSRSRPFASSATVGAAGS